MTPVERYVVKGPSGPCGSWSNAAARNKSAQDVHSIDQTWRGYPQNLFGNWTPEQVAGEMLSKCSNNQPSTIYWMDLLKSGKFTTPDMGANGHTSTTSTNENEDEFWNMLQGIQVSLVLFLVIDECIRLDLQPEDVRVRLLFVDKLTSSVMKMLGTRFLEPVICLSTC
jgi:hypothetical protein